MNNHPLTRYAGDMRQLSAPLKKFGITFFSYLEVNHASQAISGLFSDPQWGAHYLSQGYHQIGALAAHATKQLVDGTSIYLMDYIHNVSQQTENLLQNATDHNISHVFNICRSNQTTTRLYCFAAPTHHTQINHQYMQHLPDLCSYTEYFSDHLLSNRILYNEHQQAIRNRQFYMPNIDAKNPPLSLPTIMLNRDHHTRYYLDPLYPNTYLTHTEICCLKLYCRGLNSRAIAKQLKLPRNQIHRLIQSIHHKILQNQSPHRLHDILSKLHIYNIIQSGII